MGFYGLHLSSFHNLDTKKANHESTCIVSISNFISLCNLVAYKQYSTLNITLDLTRSSDRHSVN